MLLIVIRLCHVFESQVGPYIPVWSKEVSWIATGHLGQVIEGGGKRRIFAIGNWINQRPSP